MTVTLVRTRVFQFVAVLFMLAAAAGPIQAQVHYQLSEGSFYNVTFDTSSKLIYAINFDSGTIHRWETTASRALGPIASPVAGGHVVGLALNADLAVSEGRTYETRGKHFVWKVSSGQLMATLSGEVGEKFLAFSADGRKCATRKENQAITLWSLPDGKPVGSLSGHQRDVTEAVFSRDGRILASIAYQDWTRLWNAESGQLIGYLNELADELLFSPDDNYLFTRRGTTGLVWDVRHVLPVASFTLPKSIHGMAFSPDQNRLLVVDDDATYVWDYDPSQFLLSKPATATDRLTMLSAGQKRQRLSELPQLDLHRWTTGFRGSAPAVSFDGRWIATARRAVALFDTAALDVVESSVPIRLLNAPGMDKGSFRNRPEFSPDGRLVASLGERRVDVWDVESGQHLRTWNDSAVDGTGELAFSADNTMLAVPQKYNALHWFKVWDTRTGQELFALKMSELRQRLREPRGSTVYDSFASPLVFSPAGAILACGGPWVHHVLLFDIAKRKLIRELLDPTQMNKGGELMHDGQLTALAFSPDGRMIVAGYGSGIIKVWDATTGKWIRNFRDPSVERVRGGRMNNWDRVTLVAISRTGEAMTAWVNGSLKIWNTKSGDLLRTIADPSSELSLSPDGRVFTSSVKLSASEENRAQIWDAASLRVFANLNQHFEGDSGVYSPNGRLIAVSGKPEIALFDREPYDGLFCAPSITLDDARWLGRSLTRLGYLNFKAKLMATAYRTDDRAHIALALPPGGAADEIIVRSVREEVGPILAERFGPKLAVHLCSSRFRVERTIDIERTITASPQPPASQITATPQSLETQKPVALLPATEMPTTTMPFTGAPAVGEVNANDDLKGAWRVEKMIVDGKPVTFDKATMYRFDGTRLVVETPKEPSADMTYTVNAAATPLALDLTLNQSGKKTVSRMIYKIEDGTLTICHGQPNSPRPTDFTPKADAMRRLIVFQRVEADL